jgi:hypothetical protein
MGWYLVLRPDRDGEVGLEWWLDGALVATMCSRLEAFGEPCTIWWTAEEAAWRQRDRLDTPAGMLGLLRQLEQLLEELAHDEKKER